MNSPMTARPTEPWCSSHSGAGDHGDRLALGAGVELPDPLGAEPVDPRLLQPHRARLGEVPDHPQRREVVGQPGLLGQPPDPLHHRRDQVDDVGPVLGDGRQRRLGVEPLEQHDVTPGEQRLAGHQRRPVVVQRAGHDEAAVERRARATAAASVSMSDGSPATISFGRPVEPPEVGAFHAGDTASGSGPSARSAGGW